MEQLWNLYFSFKIKYKLQRDVLLVFNRLDFSHRPPPKYVFTLLGQWGCIHEKA